MTEADKIEAGTRVRQRMREKSRVLNAWPRMVYDYETKEFYDPVQRYLDKYVELVRKHRGERLFAALHSVIEAERRDWNELDGPNQGSRS